MWYEIDHPATWAGLNSFLSGAWSLFSSVFSAMLTQPVMVLILSGFLMAVVLYLVWEFFRASRK